MFGPPAGERADGAYLTDAVPGLAVDVPAQVPVSLLAYVAPDCDAERPGTVHLVLRTPDLDKDTKRRCHA